MTKYICKICANSSKNEKDSIRKKFSEKEYLVTNDKNRCILHCEKNDWYETSNNNVKLWDKSQEKVLFFWKVLDNFIKQKNNSCYLYKIIFPVFFVETTFTYNYVIKKNISIYACTFLDEAIFQNTIFEGRLSFMYLIFTEEFVFNYCSFNQEVTCALNLKLSKGSKLKNIELSFKNSKFNEKFLMNDVDFSDCTLSFENTMFNSLVDFHNTTFSNIDFRNTKFNDIVVFVDCIFKKPLDLRNTIFRGEANFLDIKFTQLLNQETSRLIKNQFEKLNNKIEANKYHALELEQYRKDIKKRIFSNFKSFLKFLPDGLVSFFHWSSSNHSSSWVRPLFWIFIVSFCTNGIMGNTTIDFSFNGWNNLFKYINILSKIEIFNGSYIAMSLNKVFLGYLYYQFLTAVRKDTRK